MVANCAFVIISELNDYWLMKFLYCVESGAVIAHMVSCSGVDDSCSWGSVCGERSCIFGLSDQVAISFCSNRCRCWAFVDFVALIPGTFEVDTGGLEVS